MRTSCLGCKNYLYDIVFHSPSREGRCNIHGWVQFWFPACLDVSKNADVSGKIQKIQQPQKTQISADFYHEKKAAIKAQIKKFGLSYVRDFWSGDRSTWSYRGVKGEVTFHREGETITVTASSAELLQILDV